MSAAVDHVEVVAEADDVAMSLEVVFAEDDDDVAVTGAVEVVDDDDDDDVELDEEAAALPESRLSVEDAGAVADWSESRLGGQSKSRRMSLVSSTPMRLPTAHTSLFLCMLMRQTTPPRPPLSSASKLRMNSPFCRSHSLTVPSSEDETTNFSLKDMHVTALM